MTPQLQLREPVYSQEEIDIRKWLQRNRQTLEGREPGEIAYLAVLVGFVLEDVCRTLSNCVDAMQGSSIENRAAFQVWCFEMPVHRMQPKVSDLAEQWQELARQTRQED